MKSTVLWALVVLNVVLLLGFLSRLTPSNTAMAQPAGPRRPGDYLMVPGNVGGPGGVVFIVDSANGQLSGLAWDESLKQLASMPKIDMAVEFAKASDAAGGAKKGNQKSGR